MNYIENESVQELRACHEVAIKIAHDIFSNNSPQDATEMVTLIYQTINKELQKKADSINTEFQNINTALNQLNKLAI